MAATTKHKNCNYVKDIASNKPKAAHCV